MTSNTINQLVRLLTQAFDGVGVRVPNTECQRIAALIHHSMDHDRRIYHTSSHLFDLCKGMNHRQTFAALFHDIVYFQLDRGFPENMDSFLNSVVKVENETVVLEPVFSNQLSIRICSSVFGFKPDEKLNLQSGMNEFLSALLAVHLLQPYLPEFELIAIAAGIEATIPFRCLEKDGRSFPEHLAQRVKETAKDLKINFAEEDITGVIADAVTLANKDVESFAASDPAYFLSTTRLLIRESSPNESSVGINLLRAYRRVLLGMADFLDALNPQCIFHAYQNTPDEQTLKDLSIVAQRNIQFAIDYIGAKVVAIATLEALSLRSDHGRLIAVSMLDKLDDQTLQNMDNLFPLINQVKDVNPELLQVLKHGCNIESNNDLNLAHLAAYMYESLGKDGTNLALKNANLMFSDELSPPAFLENLDQVMLGRISKICSFLCNEDNA